MQLTEQRVRKFLFLFGKHLFYNVSEIFITRFRFSIFRFILCSVSEQKNITHDM